MVYRAGVGPSPCPVTKLTAEILAEKLRDLQKDSLKQNAVELSQKMATEDGVQGGLKHFLNSLPRDSMLCDVSLLMGEAKLARSAFTGEE